MKKLTFLIAAVAIGAVAMPAEEILTTGAYTWSKDTVRQGSFIATAPSPFEIRSTYHAQPGYGFPVDSVWKLRNDISKYPQLKTSDKLQTAVYNMALDEMVNAVEPDTTLRTGKEWSGVWTRDVSYSIILSMAYMQPEASMVSLRRKVSRAGTIIQDTGSGGAWPVSTDRLIWAVAAYEIYKVTGDRQWLEYIYPVIRKSLEADAEVSHTGGLVKGETSFIDWRTQSYPKWMQMSDIYNSEALGTSVVHAAALRVLAEIASEMGDKKLSEQSAEAAKKIEDAINDELWLDDKGYYAMYNYGRDFSILNPRAETLGESLAILYGVASPERAAVITESNPTTPFGTAIFYPQIPDVRPYHNNALWPWVASFWAIANASAGNEQGTLEAIGSVVRPAALFATNKENFVLDNGDIATELNSSNMLWCLAGNIAITHRILFGIEFERDRLVFHPFVPKALAATRTLNGFPYRDAVLDLTVSGYGNKIASFKLDGKKHEPFVPSTLRGKHTIDIVMADNEIAPMKVNHVPNRKTLPTPVAWLEDGQLCWNPVENAEGYVVLRDGKPVQTTRQLSYPTDKPGEWQVIAFADGIETFASEPRSNRQVLVFQMPGEKTAMSSSEVSDAPSGDIEGYTGSGFVELDHATAPVTVTVDVPADGVYSLAARYANGNGPISTRNKCAVRSVSVDGNVYGVFVMPQRGSANWCDWGMTNRLHVPLKAGKHNITISFRPTDENMNLHTNHALVDAIHLSPLGDTNK